MDLHLHGWGTTRHFLLLILGLLLKQTLSALAFLHLEFEGKDLIAWDLLPHLGELLSGHAA